MNALPVDTLSTASSELSLSVCELILGREACQKRIREKPNVLPSQKSVYYSFTSPEKDLAVRNSEDFVKVDFVPENNKTHTTLVEKTTAKKSVQEEQKEILEPKAGKISEKSGILVEKTTRKSVVAPSTAEEEQKEVPVSQINYLELSEKEDSSGELTQEVIIDKSQEIITKTPTIDQSAMSKKSEKVDNAQNKQIVKVATEPATPKFNTIETQTVAVQTVTKSTDSDSDCKCQTCHCPECHPPQCLHKEIVKEAPTRDGEESSDGSGYNTNRYSPGGSHGAYCNCRSDWQQCDCDDLSENSDDSYTTDFLNLPYQNNEEYLELLRELERKLIARNRERVRRTRLEFEKRSKQNQNLDKPVYDYGGDESTSFFLRKLQQKTPRNGPPCHKCHRRANSDIMQNEKKWERYNFVDSFTKKIQNDRYSSSNNNNNNDKYAEIERSLNKSHWQLDPRSGEWIKVASYEQTHFSKPMMRHNGDAGDCRVRRECPCCRKKKYV